MRVLKFLALAHLAALLLVGGARIRDPFDAHPLTGGAVQTGGSDVSSWFKAIRPYCNQTEVGLAISRNPPPQEAAGWGHEAGCYALAGKIRRADDVLSGVRDEAERAQAAERVFQLAHHVADSGDDDSAGPIMRLTLKYMNRARPAYYMALYHAGMAEYNMGDHVVAQQHLMEFLELYRANDGWNRNARIVLAKIERGEEDAVPSGHVSFQ